MASTLLSLTFITSLLLLLWYPPTLTSALNVVHFGANPDGYTDSTKAFARAWGWACSNRNPTVIHIPKGKFVIRPITFTGPCRNRITVWIDGTILAHLNYKLFETSGHVMMFYRVNRLLVRGGTINARGQRLWACRRAGKCYSGARSLSLAWCNDAEVRGLTSLYSQQIHVGVFGCKNVVLRGLRLRAPSGSLNTDGIHLSNSDKITIRNSIIQTGDDCISIGPSSTNFKIQRIHCGPGHGISIGSLANSQEEGGVENIVVKNAVMWRTFNGVRIKSWAKPSTGYVKNVLFQNIIMRNVYYPINIDQQYCPSAQCARGNSGIAISGVTFRKIRGTSKTKMAVKLDCSPSNPCKGIRLQDIRLTYGRWKSAHMFCAHAHGYSRGVVIPRSCI